MTRKRAARSPSDDPPLLGEPEETYDVEPAPLPDDRAMSKVRDLATLQVELQRRIANGEELLARLRAFHKDVSERQLPLAMAEIGMTDFGLTGGARVAVKSFVVAGIPKPMIGRAIAILERLGRAALVKHEIKLSFGRDEDAWAKKFLRDMARRKRPIPFTRRDFVEPQTAAKFVRDFFAESRSRNEDPYETLPADVFGIYEGTVAEVAVPETLG